MKYTIEMEDNLDDIVSDTCDLVKDELLSYCEENKPDELPCLHNDLDYSGAIHELIDNAVPIYTKTIDDLFYLRGSDLEQAFDDAGIGEKKDEGFPMGWKPAAIYCYIEQGVSNWYNENAQDIFDEWKDKQNSEESDEESDEE